VRGRDHRVWLLQERLGREPRRAGVEHRGLDAPVVHQLASGMRVQSTPGAPDPSFAGFCALYVSPAATQKAVAPADHHAQGTHVSELAPLVREIDVHALVTQGTPAADRATPADARLDVYRCRGSRRCYRRPRLSPLDRSPGRLVVAGVTAPRGRPVG
jgi:hypothetical protein